MLFCLLIGCWGGYLTRVTCLEVVDPSLPPVYINCLLSDYVKRTPANGTRKHEAKISLVYKVGHLYESQYVLIVLYVVVIYSPSNGFRPWPVPRGLAVYTFPSPPVPIRISLTCVFSEEPGVD